MNCSKKSKIIEMSVLAVVFTVLIFFELFWDYTLDDIWVYGFSHYTVKGMKLYSDVNAIITPLSVYLYTIPLLVHDSFLSYAVGGAVTDILIFIMYYKIFSEFGFTKTWRVIAVACCSFVFPFVLKTNYNILTGLICLVMVYLFLKAEKAKNVDTKIIIFVGALSFAAFAVKQSTGLLLTAASCLSGFILSVIYHRNINAVAKKCGLYLLSFSASGLLFSLFLLSQGILGGTIDTILNAGDFVINIEAMKIVVGMFLVESVSVGYMTVRLYKKTKDIRYVVISIFQVFLCVAIYPLPNFGHFMTTNFMIFILMFLYWREMKDEIKETLLTTVPVGFLITLLPIVCYLASSGVAGLVLNSSDVELEAEHLYSNLDYHADLVNDYINADKEHDYLIINEVAMLCNMRNDDRYHKYYDLMFEGNIGSENALDLLKKADCDYFIVSGDRNDVFWQYDNEAMNYIYSLNRVDDIKCSNGIAFAVYENIRRD